MNQWTTSIVRWWWSNIYKRINRWRVLCNGTSAFRCAWMLHRCRWVKWQWRYNYMVLWWRLCLNKICEINKIIYLWHLEEVWNNAHEFEQIGRFKHQWVDYLLWWLVVLKMWVFKKCERDKVVILDERKILNFLPKKKKKKYQT